MRDQAWLDAVKKEAEENGLDFYTLVAAKNVGIPYDSVTKAQRNAVKELLFSHTYGGQGKGNLMGVNLKPPKKAQPRRAVAPPTSPLEGWQNAIRNAATDSRNQEALRSARAKEIIERAKGLPFENRVRALVEAHDSGVVRTNELLDELRIMVDLGTG